ncbi:MAG: helix-turn-helix domain-containing protein [Flavobacteriaceae bacterium]|nr:MAG: helix-turn-helix domain-containing protein [Flavobacteriaceae bacterium]
MNPDFNIKNYVVYGKEDYTLPSYFINVESIKKTAKAFHGHIKPHVHSNLFQVLYIKSGKGFFKSDQTYIEVNGPCIITVPEYTLHELYFNEDTEYDGKVITLANYLLDQLLNELPNGLLKLTDSINFVNEIGDYSKNNYFIKKINSYLPINSSRGRIAANSYLSLLFLKLLEYDNLSTVVQKKIKNKSYLYFRKFQQNIKETHSISKTISEYADNLRITPTHLNRICKSNVGLAASQVIQNFILLEAKRNLNYTSHTISEISHILNFNDLGYFCRFFKKHTGKTPKAYRQSQDEASNK